MQRLLTGLNPVEGPDFVSVYLDDVLIFSRTLDEHKQHLQAVVDCLAKAGLKLNPHKCRFICKEVEYLGNPRWFEAQLETPVSSEGFPSPHNGKVSAAVPWNGLLLSQVYPQVRQGCSFSPHSHPKRSKFPLDRRVPDSI